VVIWSCASKEPTSESSRALALVLKAHTHILWIVSWIVKSRSGGHPLVCLKRTHFWIFKSPSVGLARTHTLWIVSWIVKRPSGGHPLVCLNKKNANTWIVKSPSGGLSRTHTLWIVKSPSSGVARTHTHYKLYYELWRALVVVIRLCASKEPTSEFSRALVVVFPHTHMKNCKDYEL